MAAANGPTSIPQDVQELLRDHVESLEELHVLLLLHGSSGTTWSLHQIAENLAAPIDEVERALARLSASGLISCTSNGYAYHPGPGHSDVEHLVRVYREDQVGVIMFLTASAVERIRMGAIRAFADSFIIKGRKKDG